MLSATSVGAVKVMALTLRADDYLTKPFDPQSSWRGSGLSAADDALAPSANELHFPGLRIDPESRRVWRDDQPVERPRSSLNCS